MSENEQVAELDYLGMAQFLKPRGYSISGEIAYFPGGMSAICVDDNDAYQMAFGHFLAGELGRKWKDVWEAVYEAEWQIFSKEEFLAIEQAICYYESLASE